MTSARSRVTKLESTHREGRVEVEAWHPCDDDFDMYECDQYPGVRRSLEDLDADDTPDDVLRILVVYTDAPAHE